MLALRRLIAASRIYGAIWVVRAETAGVGGGPGAPLPGIAGRVEEGRVLGAAMSAAAGRQPCAVFVHGEAGVGKTRLVRAVCDEAAADGAAVLWGRGVRFGAVDAPYVALIGALEDWLDSAPPSERAKALAEAPAVALADLSKAYMWWSDSPEAAKVYAEEAARAAHRSGTHEALSHAYSALVYAYDRDERADADSTEAAAPRTAHGPPRQRDGGPGGHGCLSPCAGPPC
jgi:AAA ATPase domain